MKQTSFNKQILFSIIGVAVLIVAVVGVSFAFFNYTRTGGANIVKTGNITFNSTNTLVSVSNVFPIAKSTVDSDTTNVGSGTVTITGNTKYVNGIDFTITAQDVSSSVGTAAGKLPLSVKVTANSLTGVKTFGSNTGSILVNSYEDGTVISSGSILAKGRIPANTNVNGSLTIKAYIDAALVAITDTIQGGAITESGYTNGTTTGWINGRTVMTTAQWNALNSTGASFKIKVVAEEGSAA